MSRYSLGVRARFVLPGLLLAILIRCTAGGEIGEYFAHMPKDTLVRTLQQSAAQTTKLPDGLAMRQQLHWMPQAALLTIQNSVVNKTDRPVSLREIAIVDWTIPIAGGYDAFHYAPMSHRDDTWYGSSYWTGPDWTRVGKDWQHSGTHTSSIRCFKAPRDGQISIRGRVYKADTNGGDGVRLEVRVGRQSLWRAEIDAADKIGVEPVLSLPIHRGDAIRFIVQRRGEIGFDTTHWDPVISYEDGTRYQASEGFSRQQGAGGWYYEMESDADAAAALGSATIHRFGRQLLLQQDELLTGRLVELRPTESLPIWILADRSDSSGILLAAASTDHPVVFRCEQTENGDLAMHILTEYVDSQTILPGDAIDLPTVLLAAYQGNWLSGFRHLQQTLASNRKVAPVAVLRHALHEAARVSGFCDAQSEPEVDMIAMIQRDWQRQDELNDEVESYMSATRQHLDRAERLLHAFIDQQVDIPDGWKQELQHLQSRVQQTTQQNGQATTSESLERAANPLAAGVSAHDEGNAPPAATLQRWQSLYLQTRTLKRRIALANPLLNFGPLLFCKRVPTSYSHLVMQYYGWRARPGGGIFVLDRPGTSLACHDILAGQLTEGNVLEPRLSYDGTKIVFSYVKCRGDGSSYDPGVIDNTTDEGFYHIWTINVDGTGLKQLTSGPYDDLMPCWLPDGGIAFSSTRRRGYARCFGGQFSRRWHVYTIHRMNGDGTGIERLSAHDTNEWFPTVAHDGNIFYSRWDYIDRDAVTHQNLWAMRPDGTNPIAVWGNATSAPHCSFQLQPIPESNKIVFTASAHHSIAGGSLAIIDPSVSNNGQAAITRLTPSIPFPEAESSDIREYYAAPWPLSEDYFLVAYSPTPLVWEPGANLPNALGIYLLDTQGNRELIYRDPKIGSTNPCPLVTRPRPPMVPSMLPDDAPLTGEMLLTDVYEGLADVPRGTIKQLRSRPNLP